MEPITEKKKPGRPFGTRRIKFIPETIEKIIKGVKMGLTYKSSAINAGIHEDTLQEWMKKGREGESKYTEFHRQMEEAVENGKAHLLAIIQQAGQGGRQETKTTTKKSSKQVGDTITETTIDITTADGKSVPDWKAAAWILERRHPKEFGPKQEVALGNADGPLEIALFGGLDMGSEQLELELEQEKSGS